jgi:nitroreductase
VRYPTALDLMKTRRSIREFTDDAVPPEAIEYVL